MSKMNFNDVWRVLLIYVLMLVVGVAIVAKIIVIPHTYLYIHLANLPTY